MSVHIYSDFKPGQKVRQDNAIPTYDGVVKDLDDLVGQSLGHPLLE